MGRRCRVRVYLICYHDPAVTFTVVVLALRVDVAGLSLAMSKVVSTMAKTKWINEQMQGLTQLEVLLPTTTHTASTRVSSASHTLIVQV